MIVMSLDGDSLEARLSELLCRCKKKEEAVLYVLWYPVVIIILLSSSGPNEKQNSVIIWCISNPVCPVVSYCNNRTGMNRLGRLFARLVLLFFIYF